jgi:hypothetical protein
MRSRASGRGKIAAPRGSIARSSSLALGHEADDDVGLSRAGRRDVRRRERGEELVDVTGIGATAYEPPSPIPSLRASGVAE